MKEATSQNTCPRVLITDAVHPLLIDGLKKLDYVVDYQPTMTLSNVRESIGSYEGIIINSKIIMDKAMLDKGKQLRFIGRLGSGMEIIDQVYAKEKMVAVFGAPNGNSNAVAEQALGMLLALAHKLLLADIEVRQLIWERERNRGSEIMGKTIGIIGFGHTGSAFAQKLQGLGMRILAYDKYKEKYTEDYPYVKEATMAQIFEEAEVLSLHLPLTPETRYLVQDDFLAKFQKNIILINTSRGKIAQTESLIRALGSGKLKGLCTDVFENEKPTTYTDKEEDMYRELYKFKNTVFSPHIAGWTKESKEKLAAILLAQIKELSQSYEDKV